MSHRFFALFLALPLFMAGCKKAAHPVSHDPGLNPATPSAAVMATPPPTESATLRTNPAIDRNARVMVLCYHRFEDRPRNALTIAPADFKAQMQALKDQGIAVISMKDFLAWRRQEKNIPPRSCLLTIDDGYVSAYGVAWPILQAYGYPFTLFIYTNYVNVGGKSLTWVQLEEMRDAGVDIESHTVSHRDLRRAPKGQDYDVWLHQEVYGSKQILEDKLGIKVSGFAFPYGTYNETVRQAALEAGYEALFTVDGQPLNIDTPAGRLGRYTIESNKPAAFKAALDFGGAGDHAPTALRLAATQPMNDQHLRDPHPTVQATLAPEQDVDAGSLEMRVSGFGSVPAQYDAKGKVVTYAFTQNLAPKTYTVILSAKVTGQKVEAHWSFTVE